MADLHDLIDVRTDHIERRLVRNATSQSVGEQGRDRSFGYASCRERKRVTGSVRRDHADDARRQAECVTHRRTGVDAGALADRHKNDIECRHGAKKLQPERRDAAHEIVMKSRNEVRADCIRVARRLLARRLEVGSVFDQLDAERPHGGVFLDAVAVGDVDCCLDAV
jgi:hypothetical protein